MVSIPISKRHWQQIQIYTNRNTKQKKFNLNKKKSIPEYPRPLVTPFLTYALEFPRKQEKTTDEEITKQKQKIFIFCPIEWEKKIFKITFALLFSKVFFYYYLFDVWDLLIRSWWFYIFLCLKNLIKKNNLLTSLKHKFILISYIIKLR